MRFLIAYLCVNCLALYSVCHGRVYDKKKTKRKKDHIEVLHSGEQIRSGVPFRRGVIKHVSQNIKSAIIEQLLSPEAQERLCRQRVQKSVITRMETGHIGSKARETTEDVFNDLMKNPHILRKDFISDLPKPKVDMLNNILDQAVTQIFSKVITAKSVKRMIRPTGNNTTGHSLTKSIVSSRNKNNSLGLVNGMKRSHETKNVSRNFLKKQLLLDYKKQGQNAGNEFLHNISDPMDGPKINDSLLKEIDAVNLDAPPADVHKTPKDFVSNFESLEPDEAMYNNGEMGASPRDIEGNMMSLNADRTRLASDLEENALTKSADLRDMEKDDEEDNGGMKNFFENSRQGLTNEDEDYDEDQTHGFMKKEDEDENGRVREPAIAKDKNLPGYVSHRAPVVAKIKRPVERESDDYGTVFVKDNIASKQINLYNSDIHLAITVNSSKSRFNVMKAIARVMKELGGMTFNEEHGGGVVTKAEFDGVMVQADQEDEPAQELRSKSKRPNLPLNEQQIKITPYKEYSPTWHSNEHEEEPPQLPAEKQQLHTRKENSREHEEGVSPLVVDQIHARKEPAKEHEGEDDKDEDAMNYYQKNKGGDQSEVPDDAEERGQLIPIGPITDMDSKTKADIIRQGKHFYNIKRLGTVNHPTIPENINVDINDLKDPKPFQKLFANRVIPEPDLSSIYRSRHELLMRKAGGLANAKRRQDINDKFARFNGHVSGRKEESDTDNNESVFDNLKVKTGDADEIILGAGHNYIDEESKKSRHTFVKMPPNKNIFTSSDALMRTSKFLRKTKDYKEWPVLTLKGTISNLAQVDEKAAANTLQEDESKPEQAPKTGSELVESIASSTAMNSSMVNQTYKDVDTYMINLNKLLDDMERLKNKTGRGDIGYHVSNTSRNSTLNSTKVEKYDAVFSRLYNDIVKNKTEDVDSKRKAFLTSSLKDLTILTDLARNDTMDEVERKPYDPCGGETACVDMQLSTL